MSCFTSMRSSIRPITPTIPTMRSGWPARWPATTRRRLIVLHVVMTLGAGTGPSTARQHAAAARRIPASSSGTTFTAFSRRTRL